MPANRAWQTEYSTGALDRITVKRAVQDIMEGSIEAFRRRTDAPSPSPVEHCPPPVRVACADQVLSQVHVAGAFPTSENRSPNSTGRNLCLAVRWSSLRRRRG